MRHDTSCRAQYTNYNSNEMCITFTLTEKEYDKILHNIENLIYNSICNCPRYFLILRSIIKDAVKNISYCSLSWELWWL